MGRFDGSVALVTGGASGIGAATAHMLLDEGASVVLLDLNADAVRSAAEQLNDKFGAGRVDGHAGDVTVDADVEAAVQQAVSTLGRLDYAFNIAGAVKLGKITDIDVDDWQFTVDVILKGTFLATRHAARAMIAGRRPGAIVNVASLNSHVPMFGGSSYAAAKAGVECFTKNSALELGGHQIRVNAILPGLVDTPLTAGFLGDEALTKDFANRIVLNRPGTPAEIADACLYLASPGASYITGTSLVVDGGWEITNYPDLSAMV